MGVSNPAAAETTRYIENQTFRHPQLALRESDPQRQLLGHGEPPAEKVGKNN